MRAVLAAAAAMAAAAAETSMAAFQDEVILLQQLKAADTPRGEEKFELICDEIKGCHYDFPKPTPYLACDEKRGCHYEGLEPQRKKKVPGLFELPDLTDLAKAFELKTAESMADLMTKAGKAGKKLAAEYKGAFGGRFLQANWSKSEWIASLADRKLGHLFHYFRTHKTPIPSLSASEPYGHFIGFHMSQCVDGPMDTVTETLGLLKSSPMATGFTGSEVAEGSCLDAGYSQGPWLLFCLTGVDLYLRPEHPADFLDVPRALGTYSLRHADTAQKIQELCQNAP